MSQSFIASGVKTGRREMGRVYAELVQIRLERGSSEASAMLLVLLLLLLLLFFFVGVPFLRSGLKFPRP